MTPASVWVAWVAANVVPSLVVSALLLGARGALGTNESVVAAYVLLFGLVSALQSWVWVRWRAARPGDSAVWWGKWAGRTAVALVVAMFFGIGIVTTLDGLGHDRLGLVAGWTVAGTIVGAAQASTLGAGGGWKAAWVAASLAGWAIAAAAYSTIAAAGAGVAGSAIVRWLVGGLAVDGNIELGITAATFAVYAMLTGVILARLLARRTVSVA